MSVEIFSNEEGAVFICNTTDWAFGPKMPGANVAEAFLKYLTKDARLFTDSELETRWAEFNLTRMGCPYGHREVDVDAYGDETIFTCMHKNCTAQWDIAGEVVHDEDETDPEHEMSRAEALGEF